MSFYIEQLKASVARDQARRDEEARTPKEAAHSRLTPLSDRLEKILATIPVEVQREGLALASLRTMLRGRQGGNCHCGELGQELRRKKFVRRRNWSGGAGYNTLWYPSS